MKKNIPTSYDSPGFQAAFTLPSPAAQYPAHTELTSTAGSSATISASVNSMLPVVGLGGSAGSISALQEFIAAMPIDSGLAAQHLEREAEATKTDLRVTIEESEASTEELKAINEDLKAMNEELRSAIGELEASRAELQSTNDQLTMVNDELKTVAVKLVVA